MDAFQLDVPFSLPRLNKQSHSTYKHSIQHNSNAEWERKDCKEIVKLSTEVDSLVLVVPHDQSSCQSKYS